MNKVVHYYNFYDEDGRLMRDNTHKVEYLTTLYLLEKYIKTCSIILDASAGTGRYSFYLAEKGHIVTACDIVPKHVDTINERMQSTSLLKKTFIMDARDMSMFDNESFDAVLCMGPLYHLENEIERHKVISECLRILKNDGIILIAYINRQASYLIELKKEETLQREFLDDILSKGYQSGPKSEAFYFSSSQEIESFMSDFNVEMLCNAGVDGISYILADKINRYSESDYEYWLKNHIKYCTDPYLLGYSLHGLYIGKKKHESKGIL